MLWRGDYQNARQLLQALGRRLQKSKAKNKQDLVDSDNQPAAQFHRHRQLQAQKANVLHKVLIHIEPDLSINLRRAPNVQELLKQFLGAEPGLFEQGLIVSLRDLLGMIGAFEWHKKGVEVPALGAPPANRIYAGYGVYSPVRGEYLDLVFQASLPETGAALTAFDIGTGTGVIAAVLIRRGVSKVIATELNPRALRCAQDNFERLGLAEQVQLQAVDLFPQGQAELIVCNPPWIPAKATSLIEQAVYDPDSQMLKGFLNGLRAHLKPNGQAWLIMSDLAEHLGLRDEGWLEAEIRKNDLQVLEVLQCRPRHPKAHDPEDPLSMARSKEITSLWRLCHI